MPSIERFLSRELSVKVGGRKIGPLFLGGGFYTIGPLSAMRFFELLAALDIILGAAFRDRDLQKAREFLSLLPIHLLRPLATLIIGESIAPAHLGRMSSGQFWAAWDAMHSVNDFAYIFWKMKGQGDAAAGEDGQKLGLPHMILAAVRICGGAYTPHQILTGMPIQTLLAILESEAEIHAASQPKDQDHITEDDLAWFQKHHPEIFLEEGD